MNFQIGDTIGDYRIVDVLGRGGMGKIFRVRNLISDRVDALKIVAPDLGANAELADRFLREIKVHASLEHPNIAALRTALRVGDQFAMVMELVEGMDLEEKLRQGPIEARAALDLVDQVLSALAFAHAHGVTHRDIKPANIIVTPAGVVKLTDFGIAQSAGDPRLTATGMAMGSLYYMSPEQVSAGAVDGRSDIYSLGVTFYHMVTGRRPFDGDSGPAILAAQIMRMPAPPAEVNPDVPAAISAMIMRALEKEPARRFQTAGEWQSVLRGAASGGGSGPVPAFFDAAALARIESDLAAAVGPIARQLVLRAAQHSSSMAELCRALAEQIPGSAERRAFLRAHEIKEDTASRTPVPGAASVLDPSLLQLAKEKLAPYIGPIAGVVVNRTSRRTRTREEFFDALAAEIASEADRKKFLASFR
jgi:eukaryotic-like serine/threonine-protein kinase